MSASPSRATDVEYSFAAQHLIEMGTHILVHKGVPEPDARLVAESLVTADMWGHPSHGMLRLPWYTARIDSGATRAVTRVDTISADAAVSVLDGGDGIGQVVTQHAITAAGDAATGYGVGVVAVRNSNHFGTAAYWTRILADRNCVGILTTNGSPAMAPWGGVEKLIGANPWSIAVPGGRHGAVVLDIANIGVARGKVYAARQRGEPLPQGWAIDAGGLPTTDPQAALDGLLLPMAGHKGYAVSFMMDVLSGVLTGSAFGRDVVGPYVPDQRSGCGHLVIAIDIAAIMEPEQFQHRMDEFITSVKTSRTAPGQEILVPGELENRAVAEADGAVTLPAKTVDELNALAVSCGVDLPAPLR
ncbi:Ldh family oxidoreductase [Mycobacterium sp. 21AC1]|uniref:Ldh family oxidoreductase n=1 Tax=[Mycobacterium] appelbergii TaxID=2939269 RepID=UPI00293944D3|nr:Ldh family oxidoreductase [Mycobacterium sp. 21AC1]MDV3123938.1 Ldh family oxidoreductase [Mycobacterium sp. 21AC1]